MNIATIVWYQHVCMHHIASFILLKHKETLNEVTGDHSSSQIVPAVLEPTNGPSPLPTNEDSEENNSDLGSTPTVSHF